jgi:mannose-6-phosphate isomerase-like protein (cupin superfamily)
MNSPNLEARVINPGEGDTVVIGPITTRIVEDGTRTDHHSGAAVVTVAPRSPGPPAHVHRAHDEGFFVTSGVMRLTVGDKTIDAPVGAYVAVPRGVPHTFSNPFDETAVMFNIFTPDLYIPYFRDLKALQGGAGLNGPAILKIMSRYETEPAPAPQ